MSRSFFYMGIWVLNIYIIALGMSQCISYYVECYRILNILVFGEYSQVYPSVFVDGVESRSLNLDFEPILAHVRLHMRARLLSIHKRKLKGPNQRQKLGNRAALSDSRISKRKISFFRLSQSSFHLNL